MPNLPSETPPSIPCHSYPIGQIVEAANGLRDIFDEFTNKEITGERLERLALHAHEALPGSDPDTVFESVRYLAGRLVDRAALTELAWRLCGNLQRLRGDRPVHAWHGQREAEWVPVQLLSCRRTRWGRGLGWLYACKIMAGSPCPRLTTVTWSDKQVRLWSQDFGFDKLYASQPRYVFTHGAQFVSLRFYGLLEPTKSRQEPVFVGQQWPTSVRRYNRELLKQRFRLDKGYDCPKGLAATFPCQSCPHGYLSEAGGGSACPAATHRREWLFKPCPRCQEPLAPFDQDLPGKLCIDCTVTAAYRREQ